LPMSKMKALIVGMGKFHSVKSARLLE